MSYYNCRMILGDVYEDAVRDLKRVAGGDKLVLQSIVNRCLQAINSDSFRNWHSNTGCYLGERWIERINFLSNDASVSTAERISEIFIALVSMPDFQLAPVSGPEVSSNLVTLGDFDGGLYGVLADTSSWFDGLFFDRFATPVQYGVGEAMIILDQQDLFRLRKLVADVTPDKCQSVLVPEACLEARHRLDDLIERCLSVPYGMLAVDEVS